MPKYLLQTPHMNCLGGGSGLGLFSLVPDSDGSNNLGTFAGEPLAKMGVALRLGDSATVGRDWVRDWVSTLVMAEVGVEIAGFVAAEGLVMTSCCCCCGCCCG